jgi:hypothetical protein
MKKDVGCVAESSEILSQSLLTNIRLEDLRNVGNIAYIYTMPLPKNKVYVNT